MIFLWVVFLIAASWVAFNYAKEHGGLSFMKKENPAIQILKERFAKGEISEEEYKERKATLEDDEF